jgi:lipoyl(octanoyl) transferase
MDIRSVKTSPNNGFYNMAMDEALFTAGTPTLRFYTFVPPAVTIGRFQKFNLSEFPENMDIVRRLTGGRAIIHKGDLTYSVVVPLDSVLGKTAPEVYKKIGEMFQVGLNKLDIPAELVKSKLNSDYVNKVSCFSASARYELQLEGKKILGSAQKVENEKILQQGSLFVDSENENFNQLGVKQIMGKGFEIDKIVSAVREAFVKSGINIIDSELTDKEKELIDNLLPKYHDPQL